MEKYRFLSHEWVMADRVLSLLIAIALQCLFLTINISMLQVLTDEDWSPTTFAIFMLYFRIIPPIYTVG